MNKQISMKKIFIVTSLILVSYLQKTVAQETKMLTFQEVIKIAEEQSPTALIAKHRFRASYWMFRSYQEQFLITVMDSTGSITQLQGNMNMLLKIQLPAALRCRWHNL